MLLDLRFTFFDISNRASNLIFLLRFIGSRKSLFFPYGGKDSRLPLSPPSRGARIETPVAAILEKISWVAPFTGGAD